MLRIRTLILLCASFLAASAAFADEVGYVDCSAHADATQVFGKPRRSPEVVADLPCGERFTILVYGFYFSRIQTKDGQIGYIYSSLIAVDRGVTAIPQTTLQPASEKTKIPSTRATDAHLNAAAAAPAQPRTVSSQPVLPAPVTAPPSTTAAVSAPASDAPAPAAPATSAPATTADASAPATLPEPPAAAQPAPAQPIPAPAVEVASNTPTPNPTDTPAPATQTTAPPDVPAASAQPDAPAAATAPVSAAAAQPEPAAPAQPEPAPAQPPAIKPAIKPADTRDSWEKTLPSVRRPPLVELFGGFAFNRMAGSGAYTSASNFAGALGSFGVNVKPWLQVVGDSSYNFQTVNGTKTILYANHYGPRYYYRGLHRLRITPFGEAFIGGTRADVTATGSPTTSQNCISFKVGGGVDYRPSRHWELRLIDADYYRTSFGTNVHQTNYYVSTGIVFRFFGGNE